MELHPPRHPQYSFRLCTAGRPPALGQCPSSGKTESRTRPTPKNAPGIPQLPEYQIPATHILHDPMSMREVVRLRLPPTEKLVIVSTGLMSTIDWAHVYDSTNQVCPWKAAVIKTLGTHSALARPSHIKAQLWRWLQASARPQRGTADIHHPGCVQKTEISRQTGRPA